MDGRWRYMSLFDEMSSMRRLAGVPRARERPGSLRSAQRLFIKWVDVVMTLFRSLVRRARHG